MNAFSVVEQFERRVAEYTGAPHAIAVSSGTMAIFLSLQFKKTCFQWKKFPIFMPARTFIGVPMAALQAGYKIELEDYAWQGICDSYEIEPLGVIDCALRFKTQMFEEFLLSDLICLSFQARKILNIGEGGMILTGDKIAADWLRAARYWGRKPPHFRVEDIEMIGWQGYMTPEKAARGLHLMEYISSRGDRSQKPDYPDLRPIFERLKGTK